MKLSEKFRTLARTFLAPALIAFLAFGAQAEQKIFNDKLGPGDVIKVTVYKSPDLSGDFRIQENGQIFFPLVGRQNVAGRTLPDAEKLIGEALVAGGILQSPQVSISLVTARYAQAMVLGNVAKPGQIALEYKNTRLSDVLAMAGGINATGSETVIVNGERAGVPFRKEINLETLYQSGNHEDDLLLAGGDVVYVPRAPVFYAYGEVQKPGAYRLERQMTVPQALATAGGLTRRGTDKGLRIQRRKADGTLEEISPSANDTLRPDDVIYARESLF